MDGGAIFTGMNHPLSGEFFSNHIYFLQKCWLSPASMLFSREYLNTSHTCGSVSDFGHLAANYSLFLICRNPEIHFPIYKCCCKEQGVLMHKCAIPVSSKELGGRYVFIHSHLITTDFFICRQKTLDENLAPWMPPFTKSGLTDYIIKLIVFIYHFYNFVLMHDLSRHSSWLTNHLSPEVFTLQLPQYLRSL